LLKLQSHKSIESIPSKDWNNLLDLATCSPFIQHEYLNALEQSGCVSEETGWQPYHFTLTDDQDQLLAAIPLYLKSHSYGEYVFDWSWANAFKEHGINYYPKLLSAIPFTPVQGTRILGQDPEARSLLIKAIKDFAVQENISSIHILFPNEEELSNAIDLGFMKRDAIQFHWKNIGINSEDGKLKSFDEFLRTLNKKHRNNILRERKSIQQLNISFIHILGNQITDLDWEHFYNCYSNTYFEHGSAPYLNIEFFKMIGKSLASNIHLTIAKQDEVRIAAALIFRNRNATHEVAYGRYWGALKHIPNLHFETAYYQAIEFCISEGISTFEGGAQGEHKIHRGMSPVSLSSAHYIKDAQFAKAIENFLNREGSAIDSYRSDLEDHLPFKKTS
jgi:predicted N-acyltransferase